MTNLCHWYEPSGARRFDASDLTALEKGLLPGVTAVLKTIAQPRLQEFTVRQSVDAARSTFSKDGESPWEFASRVIKASKEKQLSVAAFGEVIHANIKRFNTDRTLAPDFDCEGWVAQWAEWVRENLLSIHGSEVSYASKNMGFGATLDLIATHRDHGIIVIDYKTQKIKGGVARFWPNFCWQLAGQAELYREERQMSKAPAIMSIVIDSAGSQAPFHSRLWTDAEQNNGLQICEAAAKIWLLSKQFKN